VQGRATVSISHVGIHFALNPLLHFFEGAGLNCLMKPDVLLCPLNGHYALQGFLPDGLLPDGILPDGFLPGCMLLVRSIPPATCFPRRGRFSLV
jgi:hypothetical protein